MKLYEEEDRDILKDDCKNTRDFYKTINKTFAKNIDEDRCQYISENDLSIEEQLVLKRFCEYLIKK